MNPDPIQITTDELQWHNRKTCRPDAAYGLDPAKDYDGLPSKLADEAAKAWVAVAMDAKQCLCGGTPRFYFADPKDPGDQSHIYCDNKRCGKIVPCGLRTLAEGIAEWNAALCDQKPGSQQQVVSRLEEVVKYYERMHRYARTALDIAGRMSLEMKEQLIESRQKLERAKSANEKLTA